MATIATPLLSFTEALKNSTNKILQFQGRSRRSEYWWTMLVVYLASLILTPFFGLLLCIATIPLTFRRLHNTGRSGWWWGVSALLQLAFIISLTYDAVMIGIELWNITDNIVNLLVTFYAKYLIWALIITAYKVVLIILLCIDSEKGENKYGESPKYVKSNTSEELNT